MKRPAGKISYSKGIPGESWLSNKRTAGIQAETGNGKSKVGLSHRRTAVKNMRAKKRKRKNDEEKEAENRREVIFFGEIGNDRGMNTPDIHISKPYIAAEQAAGANTPSPLSRPSADLPRAAEYAALENPLVLAARAFEKDGKVVLAVLTEPIYLASERAELKKLLEESAAAAGCGDAAVTFDLEVYRRISPEMPEELKSVILKKLQIA